VRLVRQRRHAAAGRLSGEPAFDETLADQLQVRRVALGGERVPGVGGEQAVTLGGQQQRGI
jgi:hypothetical protein